MIKYIVDPSKVTVSLDGTRLDIEMSLIGYSLFEPLYSNADANCSREFYVEGSISRWYDTEWLIRYEVRSMAHKRLPRKLKKHLLKVRGIQT